MGIQISIFKYKFIHPH